MALAVVLGVGVAYAFFLGWDQTRDVDPVSGRVTGPYAGWQVVGCAAVYLVVSAAGARYDRAVTTLVAPATFTLLWSLDAATDPDQDGLWPVGALLVAVGSGVGASLAARAGAAASRHRQG